MSQLLYETCYKYLSCFKLTSLVAGYIYLTELRLKSLIS